jgi:hypothetical protein
MVTCSALSIFSVLTLIFGFCFRAQAKNKSICVEVVLMEISEQKPEMPVPKDEQKAEKKPEKKPELPWSSVKSRQLKLSQTVSAGSYLPIGQTPVVYMKRLIEHFITHEKGYEAVQKDCEQRIRVELYPLAEGWTIFARYSGNGREERVDQLYPTELSQFAERAVTALLQDVPISATINRDTVLKSDSRKSAQRIKGTNHWILCLGTQLRGGTFKTAVANENEAAADSTRLFTPMTIATGYRGKFENWGVEAIAQFGIGTSHRAPRDNLAGGHIDFGGSAGAVLHFLRYTNPRGLTSFYLGSGATFELLWFSAIKAAGESGERSTLLGGGLDVDLVFGWEFMRASAVQFYLHGELHVPAYMIQNADNHGSIYTWFPSASVKLGVVF